MLTAINNTMRINKKASKTRKVFVLQIAFFFSLKLVVTVFYLQ